MSINIQIWAPIHNDRSLLVEKTRLWLIQTVTEFDQLNTTAVVWRKSWIGKHWNGNSDLTILFILGKLSSLRILNAKTIIQPSRVWYRITWWCGLYRWRQWRWNTSWRLLLRCYHHCKVWEQRLDQSWRFELCSCYSHCTHARNRYAGFGRWRNQLRFELWVNYSNLKQNVMSCF